MSIAAPQGTTYVLQPDTRPALYHCEARIKTRVKKGNTAFSSGIKMNLSLQCEGYFNTETLRYRLKCKERALTDYRGFRVKKHNKAMQMAMKAVTVNDELVFHVSPALKLLRLENTAQVRDKWAEVRPELERRYADMGDLIADFEWQLREENIQQCYVEDCFYSFLFAGIYGEAYSEETARQKELMLHHAVDSLSLPVLWHGKLKDFSRILNTGRLEFTGALQTDSPKFPLQKLNVFIGKLAPKGSRHELAFTYNGHYDLRSKSGRMDGGMLRTAVTIGDIYEKETEIHLKIRSHEQ